MRIAKIMTVVITCTIALPALSHEHATGVVKERMDLMEAIGKRMKAINTRIKNKQKLGAINEDARAIAVSAPKIVPLFPPGSTHHPTEAKATIWRNFADFERKAKSLEDESAKLANTADTDFAALAVQVRAVSQTCSGCHEAYRVRR